MLAAEGQDTPNPATSTSSYTSWEKESLQYVLDLPQGLLPDGNCSSPHWSATLLVWRSLLEKT